MIYSPSRTEAYDFCTMRGAIAYRDGWTPREADNSLLGRLVGASFAKGSEAVHQGTEPELCVSLALAHLSKQLDHYTTYGVSFPDTSRMQEQLGKALAKYHEQHPFRQWQIKGVEFGLKEYGNCRLDLLGIDPEGYGAIADLKYKRQLKLDYLNKTVNEYRDSWQFQHYPWAYNDWVKKQERAGGLPVPVPLVQRMYLVLVIADPFKILTFPFFTKDKLQVRWLQAAHQKWADISAIEKGDRQPILAATHRDAFGDCPFKRACLEMDLDPQLMQFDYVQVPKMKED